MKYLAQLWKNDIESGMTNMSLEDYIYYYSVVEDLDWE